MKAALLAQTRARAPAASAPRIVYLIHDVYDPAVERRVRMLQSGGATLVLAGFRRSDDVRFAIEGVDVIDLGRTHDAKMGARALSVARATRHLDQIVAALGAADAVMARNLEMLLLARLALSRAGVRKRHVRLIYECLDVHRLMLGQGVLGRLMRFIERRLMARADLLVVSSPGFIANYFAPKQHVSSDWLLLENQVLADAAMKAHSAPSGPPWRLGWFGVLRCQKSLDILCDIAAEAGGNIEIVLRGRPAYHEFREFDAQIAAASHVSFLGPYVQADLARIYGDVHLAWAVDYFDAGKNSDWLLPNRFYEAGAHGVACVARADTELGRKVAETGFGVAADRFDAALIAACAQNLRGGEPSDFIMDEQMCRRCVRDLVGALE